MGAEHRWGDHLFPSPSPTRHLYLETIIRNARVGNRLQRLILVEQQTQTNSDMTKLLNICCLN